jgi:hypothetical protein
MPCKSFRARFFALINCLVFLLACASACHAVAALAWNADAKGQFITSLCPGTRGTTWIGTEDNGVWCFDPSAPTGSRYTHYTQQDGLGDNNAYALAVDKAGRLWVGTLNHGVSVFNGKTWRTYGPLDGPLGSRVFALAVNPKDGGVWGATEAGLFRYENSHWTYFTRADGLPSDQASALAFDADGTLYVGTQCDGIAISSPADGYKSWRVVSGPASLPNAPSGTGLPSALINCLLVAESGTVYAGTDGGLAASTDGGESWRFVRGLDWKAKELGLYPPVTPVSVSVSGDLLSEDYVTSLAEGADGRIFVGHRQTGVEAFSPNTGLRVQSGLNGSKTDSDISYLLVSGQAAWVGLYGGGALPPAAAPAQTSLVSSVLVAPLPAAAKPPTLAELKIMLARVKRLTENMPVGGGVFLGEDWQTQGDWMGRYGNRLAVLCADEAPLDKLVQSDFTYIVKGFAGPHHIKYDGLRTFCSWVNTNDPRVLWNPSAGDRREAEWDDHGEAYSQSYEGPDVWARVTVPAGIQRLSLYFMNKDGHEQDAQDNENRFRDYVVQLKADPDSLGISQEIPPAEAADVGSLPTLAAARVHNFWFGVYEQFLVHGPAVYMVKVSKIGSRNTILQAILLDKLSGPPTKWEKLRSTWYGRDTYKPPVVPEIALPSASISTAQNLWNALAKSTDKAKIATLLPSYRILAYRAVANEATTSGKKSGAQALEQLLANWRWNLSFWDAAQREDFQRELHATWAELAAINPDLKSGKYYKFKRIHNDSPIHVFQQAIFSFDLSILRCLCFVRSAHGFSTRKCQRIRDNLCFLCNGWHRQFCKLHSHSIGYSDTGQRVEKAKRPNLFLVCHPFSCFL